MFSDPQFWVAVSFLLFIVAIFNPVRKQLTTSLDAQINEIKNKIVEAENIKKEAEKTLSELEAREEKVGKEIDELNKETEDRIKTLQEISDNKISDQIKKRKILAENKVDQIIREAKVAVKDYISNTSIETTRYILQNKLTKEKHNQLIDESIKDFAKVLKK